MVTPRNVVAFVIIHLQIPKRRNKDDFSIDAMYTFIKINIFTATITNLTNICVIVVGSCPQISFINIIC